MLLLGTKRAVFVPMALVALLADQVGKLHVTERIEPGAREAILGPWLSFTHVPALGGAFGVFRDWVEGAQLIGFALLASVATVAVLAFYRALAPREQATAGALGAILGGIASHALDRLRFGSGLDFLHLGDPTSNVLPDFSLADVAIVLGAATLIIELMATEFATRASERPPRRTR